MSHRRSLLINTNTSNPLLTDLVQYNPLTSSSVATIGVDGTDTNVTYGDFGDFQHSADFNSATSVINFGDDDNFSFGNGVTNTDFTISMRLKFDILGSVLFLDKRDASNNEYLMRLRTGNTTINGRVCDVSGSPFDEPGAATNPVTGTWYWFVFKGDSVNVIMSSYTSSGTLIGSNSKPRLTIQSNTAVDLLLGKAYNNGSFNGSIGEFAIWRRYLDLSDIALIADRYNNSLPLL